MQWQWLSLLLVLLLPVSGKCKSFGGEPIVLPLNEDVGLHVLYNGTYYIEVQGSVWFYSGPIELHSNAKWYSTAAEADNPIRVSSSSISQHANGTHGQYTRVEFELSATDGFTVRVAWEVYPQALPTSPQSGGMVVFETQYPSGASSSSLRDPFQTISTFPGFSSASGVSMLDKLEYLTFQRLWDNGTRGIGLQGYLGGLEGGMPLIQWRSGEQSPSIVSVLSPLDNFAVAYMTPHTFNRRSGEEEVRGISCGLTGMMEAVPPSFSHRYVLYFGAGGVTQTVRQWGKVLLNQKGKQHVSSDITRDYLGYWTDNGAYYYYKTLDEHPNSTYEETIIALAQYHASVGVPVQYYQFDSWWYYKDTDLSGDCTLFNCGGGVTDWVAMPSVFPNGMKYVYDQIQKPFALHNRYWAKNNSYMDEYTFFVGLSESIPQDAAFFPDLLADAASWGMKLYEQDWLVRQYSRMAELQNNVYATPNWLHAMGNAASQLDLTIQYCMPLPQIMLLSTEISAVTQMRVSDDYLHGTNQWNIGKTSMIAWALGVAPFKDNFWSASVQPGNTYGAVEENPRLETIVSALSNGPVAFGDRIGCSNRTLLLATCNADGLLLRSSKPATPIERYFGSSPPQGEVWTTFSDISSIRFAYLLSVSLTASFTVVPDDVLLPDDVSYVAFSYDDVNLSSLQRFSPSSPIVLQSTPGGSINGKQYWEFWRAAPELVGGWAFLGELDKILSLAVNRVSSLTFGMDWLSFVINGAPRESVTMAFANVASRNVVRTLCTLSDQGSSKLSCIVSSALLDCSCS